MKFITVQLICLLVCCATTSAQIQTAGSLTTQEQISRSFLEQRIDSRIPGQTPFLDDQGHSVRLADYMDKTPTLLVLGYFTCPDLCPMAFMHLAEELNGIAPVAGRDFQILIISFDPRDTPAVAAGQKKTCLRAYKWPEQAAGWHFLVGNQIAIDSVTSAVGFHYAFDQQQGKFIHPTGVIVLSPDGAISHNFFGIDAAPADLESAIHDAAGGRNSRVDQVNQQYCVDYDPASSIPGRHVMHLLQAVCITFATLLFGYIGMKITHDIRQQRRPARSQLNLREVES